MSAEPIVVEHVNYWFGEGSLRRQVLFDVSAVIRSGEIVILSGPSGSGKTTLLTLIGALRSTQEGSVRVLDHELRGAEEDTLTEVRREIGYIFQSHNLLEALTATQNVEMGMQLHEKWDPDARAKRARELLAGVGLDGFGDRHSDEMSGGQRQRVAVARALAGEPSILLADEPTASLDRHTGREIVSLIEGLARERGVTVVLVTHDPRILDVADRILSLEDGRLTSFMSAVTTDTRHLWSLLARDIRHGELVRRVREIEPAQFAELLEHVTEETREFVQMVDLAQSQTFDSMLAQVLDAFALKVGELLLAGETRVYLVDEERDDLFSLGSDGADGPSEVRVRKDEGIVGRVAASATPILLDRASSDPAFMSGVDLGRPRDPLLAMPLADSQGAVFAVIELGREEEAGAFTAADEARLSELTRPVSTMLESWSRMSCSCRSNTGLTSRSCCGRPHPEGTPCL
jgi:putative ABC transport system ATP-binding protein